MLQCPSIEVHVFFLFKFLLFKILVLFNFFPYCSVKVLSGVYPVAQVREPYTAVGYVAARLPLVERLDLKHPNTIATVFKKTKGRRTGDFELDEPCHVTSGASQVISYVTAEPQEWTAWDICDGKNQHSPFLESIILLSFSSMGRQKRLLYSKRRSFGHIQSW